MLKMALILLVVLAIALVAFFIVQSSKLLRKTEQAQALERKQQQKQDQLHPQLKQRNPHNENKPYKK